MRVTEAYIGALQVHGGGTGIELTRFRGFGGSPIPRRERFARARRHGSVDRTQFYEGRIFELAGGMYADSDQALWGLLDSLKEEVALAENALALLRWHRQGLSDDEQSEVKVEGELEYEFAAGEPLGLLKWALTLFAPDPRIYGATLKAGSYDPTTAGTGFGLAFPLAFALTFPGEGSATHLSVENQGRYPTPPVLTATGPVTNPIFENDTTGEFITTQELALLAGQTLEIDVAARSVILDGMAERPDFIDASATTWWELVKGVNLLRLNGQAMVGGQTQLAVSFRDAST